MKLNEHIKISKRALKYLFSLDKTYAICAILKSFVSAVTPYVPIYFSAKIVDALYQGETTRKLVLYVSLTVGLTFILAVIGQILSSLLTKAQNALWREEEWNYAKKAMNMEYASIEDNNTRLLLERIKQESQMGRNLWYMNVQIEKIILNVSRIIMSVSLTLSFFSLSAIPLYMKLALIVGIILSVGCGIISTAKISKIDTDFFASCEDINVLLAKYYEYIEDYSAGKDIRIYGMTEHLTNNMGDKMLQFIKRYLRNDIKKTLRALPDTFLSNLLKFGTYLVLIYASLAGAITVGSIAKYVSCIMLLIVAISGLVSAVQKTLFNHTYLRRYFAYFDIPNNMYEGTLTLPKRDDNEYYIEFRDVSFRYPNTEAYALRHINIKFKVGEKLAVVGMNGGGKTTFVKLMCRMYDPTEGEILLNGIDIRKYDYEEYLSVFSVVFQDFNLLSYTLGQNVATSDDFNRERVSECLHQAGFDDRLKSMPQGLDTYLYKNYSKDGVEISGGEAQKIALARALYKDAPFIILDEPTAALDPVSEYEIYSKFNGIVGDKTAIYISHRLASCRFCDNIVVFDKGALVQHGSHEELVADESGKYYELWNAQAQYYTGEK